MLITKNAHGYSRKKKYIIGRGFVDALSNVFNSLKASAVPAIRGIGSYVSNNKDLIAKPLLGAVGSLAATGLTAGVPALIGHIMNKNKNKKPVVTVDDPKYKEILKSLVPPTPVTNLIGSGVKIRGAGIKKF
jgi:hypothetical protein